MPYQVILRLRTAVGVVLKSQRIRDDKVSTRGHSSESIKRGRGSSIGDFYKGKPGFSPREINRQSYSQFTRRTGELNEKEPRRSLIRFSQCQETKTTAAMIIATVLIVNKITQSCDDCRCLL